MSSEGESAHAQVAALCWRVKDGRPEILLVTSRDTGRWVLPKGWPMAGKSDAEAARLEAWEEAGATGKISPICLGFYPYAKVIDEETELPCVVAVYPMKVKTLADRFPERSQRRRRWFSPAKAAEKVAEPDLADLLRGFEPSQIKG